MLQSEHYQDLMLKRYSDEADLVIVSVGYRLAPENPFPQGNEDCFDIGEYLVDHAEKEFGAKLNFMGGDSAGAHLSALTAFKLLETRPEFAFRGLVLNFGAYDLSGCLPQAHHFDLPLVLDLDIMQKFICLPLNLTFVIVRVLMVIRYFAAYLPGKSLDERRDPSISPLYADLNKLKV